MNYIYKWPKTALTFWLMCVDREQKNKAFNFNCLHRLTSTLGLEGNEVRARIYLAAPAITSAEVT